jgi:hypothetical protein
MLERYLYHQVLPVKDIGWKREKMSVTWTDLIKYPQTHTGTAAGNKMSGKMTRDDLRGNEMCDWTAIREK